MKKWSEKPDIKANINMGCYVMEPSIFDLIPRNRSYGMDDLMRKAILRKNLVQSFVSKSGFMDIGNKKSYSDANRDYLKKPKV